MVAWMRTGCMTVETEDVVTTIALLVVIVGLVGAMVAELLAFRTAAIGLVVAIAMFLWLVVSPLVSER